jgi:hypothetical protein
MVEVLDEIHRHNEYYLNVALSVVELWRRCLFLILFVILKLQANVIIIIFPPTFAIQR